ncbi:hypothetical protein R1sor_023151 [Riccia sorocarpa]|uniref:GTP-binding protein OBGM, mitochondrial n=1 Tax=Riccia sorocarpa TaxID=122646 RepID=A0ABD3GQ24_9MARC
MIREFASKLRGQTLPRSFAALENWSTRVQNGIFSNAAGGQHQRSGAAVSACLLSFPSQRNFASDSGSGKKTRKKQTPLQERKMIDKFRVHVRGGGGGAGCTSFRKSRHSRFGSADGGNGGRGGDVILVSSSAVWDFSNLQHHLNGGRGCPGSSKKRVGSRGLDKIVQVPVGTVIHLVRGAIPSLDKTVRQQESSLEDWDDLDSSQKQIDEAELSDRTPDVSPDGSYREGSEEVEIREVLMTDGESEIITPNRARKELEILDEDGESEIITPKSARKKLKLLNEDGESEIITPGSARNKEGLGNGNSEHNDDSDLDFEFTDEDEESDDEGRISRYVQNSVAEFVSVGQSLTLASGGDGGKGNAAIARGRGANKTLPSLEHEEGNPGSEADLVLELKTIADVGLVGAPNAGKSTLLGSLSRAKPMTGHYKFTTLRPNIGKLKFEDNFSCTVADIPGLIQGAHENRGLGHAFLRHIERTKILAYVVDLSAGIGENPGPLPWDQIEELVFELEQYQEGLSKRPSLIVANKIDEEGAPEALEVLKRKFPDIPIFPVCAVLEEGVDVLKEGLRSLVVNTQLDAPKLSGIREL